MDRDTMEIFGIAAGFCTTASFVPQVIRTWKTKSVEDISLRMYLLLCLGIILWIVYGLLVQSLSVVLANVVTFCLAFSVLVMKFRYGRRIKRSSKKS